MAKSFKERLGALMLAHKPPMVDHEGRPSATRLAEFTGIRKQTLQNYLRGGVPDIPARFVFRIADAFHVSVNWLWLGEGPRDPSVATDLQLHRLERLFRETKSAKSREIVVELLQNLHDIEHNKGNRK